MPEPSVRFARAAALAFAAVALLALLAGWVGAMAARGAPCRLPGCAAIPEWGEVPVPFFVLGLDFAAAWLGAVGARPGGRGARARGAMLAVAAVAALPAFAGALVGGPACPACLAVLLGQLLALALAAAAAGLRPGLPDGLDAVVTLVGFVTVTGVSFQAVLVFGDRLERGGVAPKPALLAEDGLVAEPGPPVALPARVPDVPTDRFDPRAGEAGAPVEIVLFCGFLGESCREAWRVVERVGQVFSREAVVVFEHFPAERACNSLLAPGAAEVEGDCLAARAAVCAHHQRAFWAYQRELRGLRPPVNRAALETVALTLPAQGLSPRPGLRLDRFRRCLDDAGTVEEIREDLGHAGFLGIDRAPAVFVDRRPFGPELDEGALAGAVAFALGRAEADAEGRVPSLRLRAVREGEEAAPRSTALAAPVEAP